MYLHLIQPTVCLGSLAGIEQGFTARGFDKFNNMNHEDEPWQGGGES